MAQGKTISSTLPLEDLVVDWSEVVEKPDWTNQKADADHDGYLSKEDWDTFNSKPSFDYTPEDVANKSTDNTLGGATPSDVLYPTQKAVKEFSEFLKSYKGSWDASTLLPAIIFQSTPSVLSLELPNGSGFIEAPSAITGEQANEISLEIIVDEVTSPYVLSVVGKKVTLTITQNDWISLSGQTLELPSEVAALISYIYVEVWDPGQSPAINEVFFSGAVNLTGNAGDYYEVSVAGNGYNVGDFIYNANGILWTRQEFYSDAKVQSNININGITLNNEVTINAKKVDTSVIPLLKLNNKDKFKAIQDLFLKDDTLNADVGAVIDLVDTQNLGIPSDSPRMTCAKSAGLFAEIFRTGLVSKLMLSSDGISWTECLTLPASNFQYVSYSDDGTKLAASSFNDSNVYISYDNGVTWEAHDLTDSISCVEYSGDGNYLYAGTTTNRLFVLNNSTWTEITSLPYSSNFFKISSSTDGNIVGVIIGANLYSYKRDTNQWKTIAAVWPNNIISLAMSADGLWLAYNFSQYQGSTKYVKVVNPLIPEYQYFYIYNYFVTAFDWSLDGQLFAAAIFYNPGPTSQGSIYKLENYNLIHQYPRLVFPSISAIASNLDGSKVVTSTYNGTGASHSYYLYVNNGLLPLSLNGKMVDVKSKNLINVSLPIENNDGANKIYVDDKIVDAIDTHESTYIHEDIALNTGARHSHSNISDLDNVSGTNTGDQIASTVENDSSVIGETVKDALETLDFGIKNSSSSFFGGFVNDDGTIKTLISQKKIQALTVTETSGNTVTLQSLIDNALSGDVIQINHNGPYGSILIPSSKPLTIRAGSGFNPVFTAVNAVRFSNNVDQLFLIGLKFLNCTTVDNNAKGSAISFNTLNYKCSNVYISNCYFEKCTGSSINLSYHMSIGGDNYANPYALTDLSTNLNIVDCNFLRASSDATEGAALLLRGQNGATIRRCINDSGDGTDLGWAQEGKTRGFMLQSCINCVIEDCSSIHTRGADEAYKIDQLSPGSSLFRNTVTLNRCYAEDSVQGFDNDDQGNITFNKCIAYNCTQGFTSQKATSSSIFFNCLSFKNSYGFYITANILIANLSLENNECILSGISDYYLLNSFQLNTNNLEGTRAKLLNKFLISDPVSKKETKTFTTGMTYFDLLNVAKTDSIQIHYTGSSEQDEGIDYTVSYTGGTGGKTRITLTGMLSDLINGNIIYIKYQY